MTPTTTSLLLSSTTAPLNRSTEIFSYEGVYLSALVTVKANALFFVFYALVSLLSFSRLAAGLKSLKFSESLIVILLFCARGIDILKANTVE